MTLRQKQFLKALPENGYNVARTAKKVGYSDSYATSRIYQRVRDCKAMQEVFSEEYIKKQYKKTLKQAEKSKDLTNKLRSLEGMARIKAMFTDKQEVNNKNPDKIVIAYGTAKPVEASQDVIPSTQAPNTQ